MCSRALVFSKVSINVNI
jgi:hypothetical protein